MAKPFRIQITYPNTPTIENDFATREQADTAAKAHNNRGAAVQVLELVAHWKSAGWYPARDV